MTDENFIPRPRWIKGIHYQTDEELADLNREWQDIFGKDETEELILGPNGVGYYSPGRYAEWENRSVRESCSHRGETVKVGNYEIHAGGSRYLKLGDLSDIDAIVPLDVRDTPPLYIGQRIGLINYPWEDMQPPPFGFRQFLENVIIPALASGERILVYCVGSHGRTGTFLASLIALLEPETSDPIAAVRERHCVRAVETYQQVEFIFGLMHKKVPKKYKKEFPRRRVIPYWGSPGRGEKPVDFDRKGVIDSKRIELPPHFGENLTNPEEKRGEDEGRAI